MAVLAFDFVYLSGLTADDLMSVCVSLAACLLFFKVMAKDHPNR